MNDVQRKAIAAADDKMRPALELYEQRSRLFRLVCLLPPADLKRASVALSVLTPDELSCLLGYAEGLAAWRQPAQESGDAPNAQPHPPATTAG